MNFKKLEQTVNFEPTNTITWGVKDDKYYGYSIPVTLDDETSEKIGKLSCDHKAKSSLYGSSNTIYLKSKKLSLKQESELYKKGRQHVEISFKLVGVNTRDDVNYLSFKVTKLRKTDKPEPNDDDSCPED